MSLSLFKPKATPVETTPSGLGEKLVWLQRFGQPRVGVYGGDGLWSAGIEMRTTALGADFNISAGHSNPTPDAAVDELTRRVLAALAALKGEPNDGR